VLPPGGARPMLGTNPICFGFPSDDGPVIFDMGASSMMWGEVMLHAHLGQPLPEGVGFDERGNPSRDPVAVLKGGVALFGGHKGYGLSLPAPGSHRDRPEGGRVAAGAIGAGRWK
jgi:delta1-piperideine-2-carboxylate reductase